MAIHNPQLEGGPFYWQAGPVGVLLIHGLTATVAEVRPLAERLLAAGYTVAGPLLPGHYTKPEDLNRVRWQDWVQVCEETYRRLQSDCPRVVVGGESTGAVLSLYLGFQHAEIAALLLYAPALRLNLSALDILRMRLLAPFVPWVPKRTMDEDTPWQGYPVNPLKGVLQLMALQRQVAPRLGEVRQPALIVQGKLDATVHSGVPEQIANSLGSRLIEKHWLENSAHCVILDREQDQVFELTMRFLDRILTPQQQAPSIPIDQPSRNIP